MRSFNPFESISSISSLPEVLSLAIKKINKKDPKTKLKGFQEILAWVENSQRLAEIQCFQDEWTVLYKEYAITYDRSLREIVQDINGALCRIDRNFFKPLMKSIYWLMVGTQYDPVKNIADKSRISFALLVPTEMIERLRKSLRPQILEMFCSKVSQNTLANQEQLLSTGIITEDARFTVNLDIFFAAKSFRAHFEDISDFEHSFVFPLEHFRFLIENYSLFLYFLQLLIVQLLIQYNSLLVNAGKEIHELMDCFISSGLECASGPSIHTFMLRLLCTSLSNGFFLLKWRESFCPFLYNYVNFANEESNRLIVSIISQSQFTETSKFFSHVLKSLLDQPNFYEMEKLKIYVQFLLKIAVLESFISELIVCIILRKKPFDLIPTSWIFDELSTVENSVLCDIDMYNIYCKVLETSFSFDVLLNIPFAKFVFDSHLAQILTQRCPELSSHQLLLLLNKSISSAYFSFILQIFFSKMNEDNSVFLNDFEPNLKMMASIVNSCEKQAMAPLIICLQEQFLNLSVDLKQEIMRKHGAKLLCILLMSQEYEYSINFINHLFEQMDSAQKFSVLQLLPIIVDYRGKIFSVPFQDFLESVDYESLSEEFALNILTFVLNNFDTWMLNYIIDLCANIPLEALIDHKMSLSKVFSSDWSSSLEALLTKKLFFNHHLIPLFFVLENHQSDLFSHFAHLIPKHLSSDQTLWLCKLLDIFIDSAKIPCESIVVSFVSLLVNLEYYKIVSYFEDNVKYSEAIAAITQLRTRLISIIKDEISTNSLSAIVSTVIFSCKTYCLSNFEYLFVGILESLMQNNDNASMDAVASFIWEFDFVLEPSVREYYFSNLNSPLSDNDIYVVLRARLLAKEYSSTFEFVECLSILSPMEIVRILNWKGILNHKKIRSDTLEYIISRLDLSKLTKTEVSYLADFAGTVCSGNDISLDFWEAHHNFIHCILDKSLGSFNLLTNDEIDKDFQLQLLGVLKIITSYLNQNTPLLTEYQLQIVSDIPKLHELRWIRVFSDFRLDIMNEMSKILRCYFSSNIGILDIDVYSKLWNQTYSFDFIMAVRFLFALKIDNILNLASTNKAPDDAFLLFPFKNFYWLLFNLFDQANEPMQMLKSLCLLDIFLSFAEGSMEDRQLLSAYSNFFNEHILGKAFPVFKELLLWDSEICYDLSKLEVFSFNIENSVDWHADLILYSAHIVSRLAKTLPSSLRQWKSSLTRRDQYLLEKHFSAHFSPALISRELLRIKRSKEINDKLSNLSVQIIQTSTNCLISAKYSIEDISITLEITVPPSFPLLPVSVAGGEKHGISEVKWRSWILASHTLFNSENISIIDGIILWKSNVEKSFQGTEACPICYCVFHPSDRSLPSPSCKTCHNKYHSSCLYKWFKSGGNATCPMCRALF